MPKTKQDSKKPSKPTGDNVVMNQTYAIRTMTGDESSGEDFDLLPNSSTDDLDISTHCSDKLDSSPSRETELDSSIETSSDASDLDKVAEMVATKISNKKKATPKKTTPKKTTPRKTTLKKVTPKKDVSKKMFTNKTVTKKVTPRKATPRKATPRKVTPRKIIAKDSTRKGTPIRTGQKKVLTMKDNKQNGKEPAKTVVTKVKTDVAAKKTITQKNEMTKSNKSKLSYVEKIQKVMEEDKKPMAWLTIRKRVILESVDESKSTSMMSTAVKRAMMKAISDLTILRYKDSLDAIGLKGKFILNKNNGNQNKSGKVKDTAENSTKKLKSENGSEKLKKMTKTKADALKNRRRSVSNDATRKRVKESINMLKKNNRRSKSSDAILSKRKLKIKKNASEHF